jgi:hypothetical protein
MKKLPSFPFQARISGGRVVTVTGLHWSGLLETEGHGLVPLNVVPLVTPEPASVRAQSTAIEPEPAKQWTRRGCFKQAPMTPRERKLKANSTRLWLQATLHAGPRAAVEVLQLARLEGVSIRGLRRAKRRLGVQSVKRGGQRQGWGATLVWQFPAEAS